MLELSELDFDHKVVCYTYTLLPTVIKYFINPWRRVAQLGLQYSKGNKNAHCKAYNQQESSLLNNTSTIKYKITIVIITYVHWQYQSIIRGINISTLA